MSDFMISQGKAQEAKDELTRMITSSDVEPYRSIAQKKLAGLLRAEGHLKESAYYYQESLKKAPPELGPEIERGLAEVYEMMGQKDQASALYKKLGIQKN